MRYLTKPALEPHDQEILDLFKNPAGREAAFRKLAHRYQKGIYGIIRKLVINHDDADDLVQEAFVKIWKGLDNFDGQSGLFTWIYRIATNEALQFLRKKKRLTWILSDSSTILEVYLKEDPVLSADEVQMRLHKAILKLPDKQRLVFHLRYYDGLSYEKIAEITNTREGSLKASYHQAVLKIKKYLL